MAAFGDGKLESTGKDSSDLGTSDDAGFKDPLITGFEKNDDDEGIESLNTEPSTPSDAPVSPTDTSTTCSLANLPSERDDDAETKDLFVKVDNPEKHTTTLDAYITFRVSTKTTRAEFESSEYTVRRRFNDFLWLRERLEECYPTHLVPPLPQKHTLTRLDHFSLEFVHMRMKALQKFLFRLADHPVLSFDKNFNVFLTAKASEFQSYRKQGKGIFSQMTDSIHNLGASYMLRNRPAEFTHMYEYVSVFGEKMGVMDRIAGRVLREQTDYHSELSGMAPCYSLWANSEDQLKAPLLSLYTAVDQSCNHLKDLVDATGDGLCQPLKEYVLYTECIKAVLRKRDAIQMEYDRVQEELSKRKDEREHLTKQKEVLNDKTEVADANLKADMDRWQKTKRHELKEILTTMADRQIEHYEKCLLAWQDAIRGIQRKEEEEEEGEVGATDLEDADIVHFSRARRSGETPATATATATTTTSTTATPSPTTTTTTTTTVSATSTSGEGGVAAGPLSDEDVVSAVESDGADSH
ncbi:sorting nexin-30-like isoform X2 [Babylonia areolata]|uniref:sorting nexin-30-like isoform X2 n=1 Tax=Babylonia areolata TaxID=304850 RepID=UPI003FD31B92